MRTLLAAALLLLVAAPAALGGASARPEIVPTTGERFPDRGYIVTLPTRERLTTSQVEVLENGEPVDSLSVTTPGAVGGGAVILAIDASNSMAGDPIRQAMAAARAFVERRAQDTPLGVVLFGGETRTLLAPTTDAVAIDNALAGSPPLTEGTHIYDGLEAARTELANLGARSGSIVLLSDGADVGSTISRDEATKRLADGGIRVFSVGLRSRTYDDAALRAISDGTRGTYSEVGSAGQLTGVFEALGYRLSNEYLILYRSLALTDAPVNVSIRIDGYDGVVRDEYTAPPLANPFGELIDVPVTEKAVKSPISMVVVVIAIIGLLGLAVGNFVRLRGRGRFRRRMGEYVTLPIEEQARERRAEIAAFLSKEANTRIRGLGWLRNFASDCELAEIRWSPATLVFWGIGGGILAGLLFALVLGSSWAFLLGLLVPIGVRQYVSFKLRRKRKLFGEQLPDNLDVLASALRAGYSLVGALAVVAEDAPEPSRSELRRVIADEQLGAPLEDAFDVCVRRMDNRDLEQVALVALLQREAGGNAAEVIDQVSTNIRGRMELRRLVRTLTAQGRLARWIVSLLPVALFGAIFLINRDYLRPLWTEGLGIGAMVLATIMVVSGSFVIKKIVDIKV